MGATQTLAVGWKRTVQPRQSPQLGPTCRHAHTPCVFPCSLVASAAHVHMQEEEEEEEEEEGEEEEEKETEKEEEGTSAATPSG